MLFDLSLLNPDVKPKVIFPEKGEFLSFTNRTLSQPINFCCVYDLEAYLKPDDTAGVLNTHHISGFNVTGISTKDSSIFHSDSFINSVKNLRDSADQIFEKQYRMLPLTPQERQEFKKATKCFQCGYKFQGKD